MDNIKKEKVKVKADTNRLQKAFLERELNLEKVSLLKSEIKKNPQDYKLILELVQTLNNLEQYEEALLTINQLKGTEFENQNFYLLTANILSCLNENEKALENYKKALEYNNSYQIWFNIASIYNKLSDIDNAILAYKNVCNLNPNIYQAWFNLGNLYYKKGDFENAILAYNKVLDIDKNNLLALNNLSLIYSKNNDVNKFTKYI